MTSTLPQAHPTEHPERHEHSDIGPRPLIIFGLIVIGLAIVIHIGLYFLYGLYTILPAEQRKQQPRSAVPLTIQVPSPRLQGLPGFNPNLPTVDMQLLKETYDRILSTSGPSEQPGQLRIPIDRAMQLLLQRGLPLPHPASTQPTTPPR
ncbi:MAG: hypothetical protein ACM359_16380 [Bacillota bacterium]